MAARRGLSRSAGEAYLVSALASGLRPSARTSTYVERAAEGAPERLWLNGADGPLSAARAVLFDFGGTLDADGLAWKERFQRLFQAEGVAVEPRSFDPVFYAADDALVGAVPETFSLEDTIRRVADALARTLRPGDAALGLRIAARFLADARACFEANAPILERLSRRYRLGVVSNFYGNLATVCDNAQVRRYFGVIVDSARVGLSKPDPRMFVTAVEALGIEPGRAVMVGDSLARDMAGARAAGMAHIWLTPAPERQGRPCCPGDRVIRSLRDLEGILS